MRRLWSSAAALVCGGMVGVASAWGSDGSLLVVVEAPPGLGVDATEVRQRIASELGQRVVAPREPTAGAASSVLIVALDGGEIRMSLREGSTTRVARVIPSSAEPPVRLRAIAWLAGNLARDQAGAILALQRPADEPAPPRPVVAALPEPAPTRAATEPPPLPVPAAAPTASVDAYGGAEGGALDARWVVVAAGGLTATRTCDGCLPTLAPTLDSNYALEVQRQSAPSGVIMGAALDSGPYAHLMGALGFVGSRWQRRGWFLEANVGAGVLVGRVQVANSSVTSSSATGTHSETTVATQVQPALYARAVGTIGRPISRDFDLVARLGVHLASSGLATDFLSATAGVRLKLP